jgi:hypothetical protein
MFYDDARIFQTSNLGVRGSNPFRRANKINDLDVYKKSLGTF